MITIPVRVCGESWDNPDEVYTLLQQAAGSPIVLNIQTEGPSLTAFGIVKILNEYCERYSADPKKIYITNWPNRSDTVNFTLVDKHHISHFFARSKEYWPEPIIQRSQYRLGYFIGRKTVSRTVMMHYLYNTYKSQCLLSCMTTRIPLPWDKNVTGIELDTLDQWISSDEQAKFCQWWANNPVTSIDHSAVHDQYIPGKNTNKNLLKFYHKFDIELVAESYTRGDTFFVTEKTVRPISAGKPILLFGPKQFLQRLRSLGYETYGSLWDESYDYLEGPERWSALKTVIDFIMNLSSSELEILLSKATEIANRNRIHLANTIGIPV